MAIKKASDKREEGPKITSDTVDGAAEPLGGPPATLSAKAADTDRPKGPKFPYAVARGKAITSPRGVLANPNNQGEADEVRETDFEPEVLETLVRKGYVVDHTAPGK